MSTDDEPKTATRAYLDSIDPTGLLSPQERKRLIMAYGAGVDKGLTEAQEILGQMTNDIAAGQVPPDIADALTAAAKAGPWGKLRDIVIELRANADKLGGQMSGHIQRVGFQAQVEVLTSVLDAMDTFEREGL